MAGLKEIKNHIGSVRETQKITNAMYLISSTKLIRAKADLEQTRPYFDALRTEIKRIFRTAIYTDSIYFYPTDDNTPREGTYGCLVITADKGLAGVYNKNAIKKTEELLKTHPDTKLFVVGEYGRHLFAQRRIPVEHSFLYSAQNPTLDRAREISSYLLNLYDNAELQEIYVVYTNLKNRLDFETKVTRLLPFHRSRFATPAKEKAVVKPFEFVPSVTAILDNLIPSYISGFIYSALIDSFCCEQNARMMAMDTANRNAEKLLGDLKLKYNRVRQAAITQEITEVSAGAKSLHRSN